MYVMHNFAVKMNEVKTNLRYLDRNQSTLDFAEKKSREIIGSQICIIYGTFVTLPF